MAHTYSHLYGLPATGLRFFTVYGPGDDLIWRRCCLPERYWPANPSRCLTTASARDFTYIDIAEGVMRYCDKPATPNPEFDPLQPDPATAAAPHRVFNIGNSQPTELLSFIEVMEQALGREAVKEFQPMQPGDVVATAADTSALEQWVAFKPSTPLEIGIEGFAWWYKDYFKV